MSAIQHGIMEVEMGSFFTSTQIFNSEMLGSKQFIDKFCKKMAEEGYESCKSDESEISYILKFADNCKWVAITSEAYEQGDKNPQKDTGRIAKMLKTTCINTEVIDSDCAIMDLYDKNGKKADSLVMGRADDYFDDVIPQPSEKIWEPFLCNDSTWQQFSEILNGKYVFVEEGLSKLASVIGIDDCNINFAADSADESDKNTFFLSFRQSNAKKATLKSAFIKTFGDALEPLGFVNLKNTKMPFFVRVINGDILNVITYRIKGTIKSGYKTMELLFGISSLYNPHMDFIDNEFYTSVKSVNALFFCDYYNELKIVPKRSTVTDVFKFESELWNTAQFCFGDPEKEMSEFKNRITRFLCSSDDTNHLMTAMNNALNVFQDIVLPIMEHIKNNHEFIDYCFSWNKNMILCNDIETFKTDNAYYYSEGLMLVKEKYSADTKKYAEKIIEKKVELIKDGQMGMGEARNIEEFKERYYNKWMKNEEIRNEIINSPELCALFCMEADKIKENNRIVLEKHGYKF